MQNFLVNRLIVLINRYKSSWLSMTIIKSITKSVLAQKMFKCVQKVVVAQRVRFAHDNVWNVQMLFDFVKKYYILSSEAEHVIK